MTSFYQSCVIHIFQVHVPLSSALLVTLFNTTNFDAEYIFTKNNKFDLHLIKYLTL